MKNNNEIKRQKNLNLIKIINDINKEINNDIATQTNLNSNNKNEEYIGISEIQYHKILYFLYGTFYRKYKKELFNASFEAWKYGPVEINFRNKYKELIKEENNKCLDFDNKISELNIDIYISNEEEQFIEKRINELLKISSFNLVNMSHDTDPWKNNFKENENHILIPIDDIKKYFQL